MSGYFLAANAGVMRGRDLGRFPFFFAGESRLFGTDCRCCCM